MEDGLLDVYEIVKNFISDLFKIKNKNASNSMILCIEDELISIFGQYNFIITNKGKWYYKYNIILLKFI